MTADVECPYCGAGQEICHDDGAGYAEDKTHEQTCSACEKVFAFTTRISFHYKAAKADCLNGAEHRWKMSSTYPRRYAMWQCQDCDAEKAPSETELSALEAKESA